MNITALRHSLLLTAATAAGASLIFAGVSGLALAAAPPMLAISSTPLTIIIPSHPQVLIALTNSNSMDSSDNITDDSNTSLTGHPPTSAIMTWSGITGVVGYPNLAMSSSPANYVVPAGFTSPITLGAAGSSQPYTPVIYSYTTPPFVAGGGWYCNVYNTWTLEPPAGGPLSNWFSNYPYPYPYSMPAAPPPIPFVTSYYPSALPPPGNYPFVSLYVPSAERLARGAVPYGLSALSPAAMLLGLDNLSYLVSDGGATGGSKPKPRTGGGAGPPPPPPCGPGSVPFVACPPPPPPPPPTCGPLSVSRTPCEPPQYCVQWYWNAEYNTTTTYTAHGDNSASRLNIAKASIGAVLQQYSSSTDFGLMDYSVSGSQWNQTWAYYLSPPGGFAFSNVYSGPALPLHWVNNPCYGSGSPECSSMTSLYGFALTSDAFMQVAGSGDDPDIDDVFLTTDTGTFSAVAFAAYNLPNPSAPSPANPYTGFTLSQYNTGAVQILYRATNPQLGSGANGAIYNYPTNAGFVPYAQQVLYSQRGYIQNGTVSSNSGNMLYPTSGAAVASAGSNPTVAQVSAFVANFTPFLEPENDVVGNVPPTAPLYSKYASAIFSNAGQSPIAGILNTALAQYGAAPTGTCPPQRYVILMTDGLPTMDLSGNLWPPIGSAAAVGYGVTASYNGNGSLASTNDQALTDAITKLSALKAAGIKTFVIGMGPGVDPTLNPAAAKVLTAMAVAGGTGTASPTGYFPGTNPATVVADLQAILNIISVNNVSSVSAAANTSSLNTGTRVYQASYNGYSGAYHDWTGDIKAYPVAANGSVNTSAVPLWSARNELNQLATGSANPTGTGAGWDTARLVTTWNPAAGAAVPFRWADLSSTQQADLKTTLTDTQGPARLNYLRGDTTNEIHNGGSFRDRTAILGDIVDSATLYVGASNGPYAAQPGYQTFATATASRPAMLYVGANDGMLHAFNAATGQEQFAFVPNGVFSNLINLTSTTYNRAHQFFVDGSPSAGDVRFSDGSWHTMLVGGLNDGGQSIYALNVTSPQSLTTELAVAGSVQWEFTDATLGLTYSRPVVAQTNVTSGSNANPFGFLVFFGSGYNNSDGNDWIYAVNPQTGKLVKKINLCAAVAGACSSTAPNGLSSPVVINRGGNVSQPVDTLYAGDLQGNLWRVDISNSNPGSWTVSLLFQARNAARNMQPITVTPAVSLAPTFPGVTGTVVYFGTGEYLTNADQSSTQTQSFYAILDNGSGATVTRSRLVKQVITDVAAGAATAAPGVTTVETRTVTNNSVNWSTQPGWYMDLPNSGERAITDPRLFGGEVVFTTFVPAPGATCTAGGAAFLMAVNYTNGGSFPQPQLDINGDGKIDANDQLAGGGNPVGIGLGRVFASAPAMLSANLGAIQVMKLTTLSSGKIANVGERGGQPGRRSWWQIR